MRVKKIYWTIAAMTLFVSFVSTTNTPLTFNIPKGWPQPEYDFSKNPLTEEGFRLGRHLFYEPMLSRDNTISCASCHLQASAFTHVDHAVSHGIEGKFGTRNSPSLMNLAWQKTFMWDGGVNHLDVQPLSPITSPVEMDEKLDNIAKKLNTSVKYKTLFKKAFGDSVVTGQKILLALSQFEVQLISSNSKYDKFIRKESGGEFCEQERNWYRLFTANCVSCHKEPLFTNGNYENNGLPVDTSYNDVGRMKISLRASDSLKFKVPTLRNVQFSFPYMHDGRFKELLDVVNHYSNGIVQSKTLSPQLQKPIVLNANEKIDLVAFLLTLSDTTFTMNKRFGYPRE